MSRRKITSNYFKAKHFLTLIVGFKILRLTMIILCIKYLYLINLKFRILQNIQNMNIWIKKHITYNQYKYD